MKNVDLICSECGSHMNVALSQYTYQTKKNPNRDWFCSRSCSTSYANKHKRTIAQQDQRANQLRAQQSVASQAGIKARKLYDPYFVWYVHRIAYDHRFGHMSQDDKLATEALLRQQWMKQQGICALTGLMLELRLGADGKTLSGNPFLIASVDRINCSLPYQEGNVQWVSQAMNLARNNTPLDQFKHHMKVLW